MPPADRGLLPPGVGAADRVVLFDGVCRLCAAWVRFLIRFDRRQEFRLATMQSAQGQAILSWFGLPRAHFESMLLVEGAAIHTKSTAFIRVMARLPWPWPVLTVSWLVPAPLRNWLYDRVARNRYRLFGRYPACVLPSPQHAARFLDADEHRAPVLGKR